MVIEFPGGNLTCIHPAYLKEMQSSSFGKGINAQSADTAAGNAAGEPKPILEPEADAAGEQPNPIMDSEAPAAPEAPPAKLAKAEKPAKEKKEKQPKLVLPEEKVRFTARVKQFALSWNHFNEMNDEVVIFENVRIEQDEPIEVGLAWGSHSKTLKKLELVPGEQLEFDGKIVKKSLPKARCRG